MKKRRKIWAVATALCMLLTLLPAPVLAEDDPAEYRIPAGAEIL